MAYLIEHNHIPTVVTELALPKNLRKGETKHFATGQAAFAHPLAVVQEKAVTPDLILPDSDLPVMAGGKSPAAVFRLPIAKRVGVFRLAASIRPIDRKRARRHSLEKGFFSKLPDEASGA